MIHLLFDTETTNLIKNTLQPVHKQPRVIEVFGLALDDERDFAEVGSFHSYVNPGIPIPDTARKITGITDDKVKDAPTFADIADAWQEQLDGADVIVAHNLSYDLQILEFEYARLGKTIRFPDRKICTVETTEWMKGFRLSLTALHTELFGEAFEGAHGAEADVRAMARCYVELHKRGDI